MLPKTIYALATSAVSSAIAVIRISGTQAVEALTRLGIKSIPTHQQIAYRKIFDLSGSLIDEGLVAFFAGPKSYTGEDVAEINLHPSRFIIEKVLSALSEIEGLQLAEPGEFSKRAFFNHKLDLVQAEAIPDLIAAETELQHAQALAQLRGELGKIYENWRAELMNALAQLTAYLDFPEEDLSPKLTSQIAASTENIAAQITEHLNDNAVGQKIKEGLTIAIIGAPNVGKSSLLNYLAKSEVAIVSETAGTTRDLIPVRLIVAAVPVTIYDTAGLRKARNKIESEGIRRAVEKAANADIKVLVIDATKSEAVAEIDERTILVRNKTDLSSATNDSAISISVTKQLGLNQLQNAIETKVRELTAKTSSPLITQERYRIALKNCLRYLSNFDLNQNLEIACEELRAAICELGKITGRVGVEDLLDVVFANFCIGK